VQEHFNFLKLYPMPDPINTNMYSDNRQILRPPLYLGAQCSKKQIKVRRCQTNLHFKFVVEFWKEIPSIRRKIKGHARIPLKEKIQPSEIKLGGRRER
jgi:hypothetical protein